MNAAASPAGLAATWDLRQGERELLLSCLGCIALGFVLVLGSEHAAGRQLTASAVLPLLIYGLSLIGLHLALVLLQFRGDQVLTAVVACLAGFGLLAQYRMGAFAGTLGAGDPELYLIPAGFAALLITAAAGANGRYRWLAKGLWLWAGVSLVLLVVLLVTGTRFRGAVYALGFTTPTEVLKVTVILGLAAYLERHARALARWHPRFPLLPPLRALWPLLVFWVLLVGLLALQRDLGMIVILSVTLLVVLVRATGRVGYFGYGLLAAVGSGALLLTFFAHGQRRVEAWLDPFQDPTGDGWQILQGLSGMYAGGLWGEGFGNGSTEYTPIARSDFIYAVIGEELGFLGCVLVALFFLILVQRGIMIAGQARTDFGRLLAAGLTTVLAVQTLLNLGGVTKAIPLTGITLPFISHGGASLLTTFTAVGLLLAISDGPPGAGRRPARTVKRAPAADATPSAPVPAPRPVDRPARPRRRPAAAKTP